MIARVRIAPVERWCKKQINAAKSCGVNPNDAVGLIVAIETHTMEDGQCGARRWHLEAASANSFGEMVGHNVDKNRWACEHVLVLD